MSMPIPDYRVEIDQNKTLYPGDEIELEFKAAQSMFWKSLQIGLIETRLEKQHPEWEMISQETSADGDRLTWRFRVRDVPAAQAGVPVSLIIKAIIVIGGGLFIYLTMGKVYQIVNEVSESPALATGAMLIPVAAVLFLLAGLKK